MLNHTYRDYLYLPPLSHLDYALSESGLSTPVYLNSSKCHGGRELCPLQKEQQ